MDFRRNLISCVAVLALLTLTDTAAAAGTGLVWEIVINKIVDSLTGPVVRAGIIAAIVIFGLLLAIGEPGPLWRRVFQMIFGLSMAAGAASIAASLLPLSSGAVF